MTYQIRHVVRVLGIGCLFALLGCGDLSGASLWAQGGTPQKHKVLVCHIPQGNMENAHEISVAESAVPAHLDHGDLLGACPMVFACTEQGIRDAIAEGGGPHYFDCVGPTTVPTEAEIVINNDVILDGEGDLIVDAGGAVSVEAGDVAPKVNGAHRVFSIPEGVTAELIGFTVTGGSTTGEGGGILNGGTFTLTNSAVTGNHADLGGGVRNLDTGTLTVAHSDVSQNTAIRFGGGLHNRGQAEVVDSTVSGNETGNGSAGISNWPEGANITLTRTTVTGNVTAGSGGGMSNAGIATFNETTVSNNQAGLGAGGVVNAATGELIMTDSVVTGNAAETEGGGGIWNEGAMRLSQVTVSSNSAPNDGGGVLNLETGTLTVMASIVSGNTANIGGGIVSGGTLTLADSTIAGNTALASSGGLRNLATGTLTVVNTTISHNTAAVFGGGMHNLGQAELVDTTVSNNATGNGSGGISNPPSGTLTLTRVVVRDNVSGAEGGGGGVWNAGTMTLNETTVTANQAAGGPGGGIENDGVLALANSTISGNSAGNDGGGVRNTETGMLLVTRSTVTGNAAGTWTGGIRSYGVAEIIDTTVSNNTAVNGQGGIANRPSGNMAIAGVTVWENIIANAGAMTVTNTTVSTNEAGIANLDTGSMSMVSATVSGVRNDGAMTVRNNIIDGDCQLTAPLESFGGNIESPGNTCTLIPPFDLFNVPVAQLGLGPLQDNGGPTWTHALLPGSVAIDSVEACVNAAGFPLLVDQRGAPRPYGPACDSGAFELGAVPLPRDLCVNDADRAVYESLAYIDGGGNPSTCTDAASSIAADCVFGSEFSTPPLAGCPAEVQAVIACYPNCSPDVIAAFDQCVADCTEGATGLSTECAGCYGGWAGCGAQTCVPECAAGATQPLCTDCLFAAGCTGLFDACSGLPGDIDCGTGGTGGMEYAQDFESLDQASPAALGDDGWLVFGQVVDGSGAFKFDYGPFPAPNGTPGFSSIVTGEGGPDQGAQQMVVYNDYNCCDPNQGHRNGTDRVTSLVYQEPFTLGNPISADDVGKTLEFSFDARRGDINDPTGSSTALAFIQTLDPGFAQTNFVQIDMTNLPAGTWNRYSISLTIDAGLVGQYLEFGFLSTASSFEPSGVFYDNILAVL